MRDKVDPRTCVAFFSAIALLDKTLIKSCKDLHIAGFVCYKTLMLESAADEIERKRLICDARLLAMLQQRNTASAYELDRDDSGNKNFTMLPAQLKQDLSIDHRTTIFRLGAMLDGILCGEKLAHGEKLHEMVESMLNQEPADAAAVVKHQVLTLLNAIAARCLGKNPDSRFQSMQEVIMFQKQSWVS